MPCVQFVLSQGRKGDIPSELCEIVEAQPFKGFLTGDQTRYMLNSACRSPKENAKLITGEGLKILGHAHDSSPKNGTLDAFGMRVSDQMEIISARVLAAPKIAYSPQNTVLDVQQGKASWNLLRVQFPEGGKLTNWAVLALNEGHRDDFSDEGALGAIATKFAASCTSHGIKVNGPPQSLVICRLPGNDTPMKEYAGQVIDRHISNICHPSGKDKINFLLILLSDDNKYVYSWVRYSTDVKYGIPSVCSISSKIRKEKGQMQYLGNLVMKANLKLGGRNHQLHNSSGLLRILGKDSMVLGADVTHPQKGQSVDHTPSISAVVGSYENTYSLYPGSLRLQKSKQEVRSARFQLTPAPSLRI